MGSISVLPVFLSISVALTVLFFLSKLFKKEYKPAKFLSIDGLRGYLAFFVFLHHSSIYFFYIRKWGWEPPPSSLYFHFGTTSVCLFFMITSFLFVTKLIDSNKNPIDWLNLMVGRILRLYPLFLVAFTLSFIYAGISTQFKLNEPVSAMGKELGNWFLFSIFDAPAINGVKETSLFMLGVLWSLKYEWLFYLILPLMGFIFFKSKPSWLTLIITLGISYAIIKSSFFYWSNIYIFIGGIVAAFLAKSEKFCLLASSKVASLIIISCLGLTVMFFKTSYEPIPLILVSVSFIGIACGNSLFGILTTKLSCKFGQLSYGMYLLHGLLLFGIFHFVIGLDNAAKLSTRQFWMLISFLGAILTAVCFFLYHHLEAPALKKSSKVTAFLRRFVPKPIQQKIKSVEKPYLSEV